MLVPELITNNQLHSPAFIYDLGAIGRQLQALNKLSQRTGLKILYSTKACCETEVLQFLAPRLHGFSVSSCNEARLARQILGSGGLVHLTTPGLRGDEAEELAALCDLISFNSVSQFQHFRSLTSNDSGYGLRINPQTKFALDERFDPCRKHSKLGVPLDELSHVLQTQPQSFEAIEGIHFHNNRDSIDFSQLLETVLQVEAKASKLLKQVKWINLGGGYLFGENLKRDPLYRTVDLLSSKYQLECYIEPGTTIVRNAGYLVSTVLDIFERDGKMIAVLDTSVNHMPEMFEYQKSPEVMHNGYARRYSYLLAGCTCLAGDLFGEHSFAVPLQAGSRIVFKNLGAYILPKAHMFNGINLPSIYVLEEDQSLSLKKRYTYEDFRNRIA